MHVIYNVEMEGISSRENLEGCTDKSIFSKGDWPLYIELNNGQIIGCDILIEATGVIPNSDMWSRACEKVCLYQ